MNPEKAAILPLKKNGMAKDFFYSIVIGIIVNMVITIASTFLSFKSGIGTTIDTAILVLILLALVGKFSIRNAAMAECIARASISCASQMAMYYAAFIMFGTSNTSKDIIKIAIIIITSSILGILFFSTVSGYFQDEGKFSFPMVKPRIDLFSTLKKDGKNLKLIFSLGITVLYSCFVNIAGFIPKKIKFFNSSNVFVLDNNPLLIAIGYLIGYKTYMIMGIGFIYSLIIYLVFKGNDFVKHIMNPYIYSVVISFTLTQGALTIYEALKKLKIRSLNMFNIFKNKPLKLNLTSLHTSSVFIVICFLVFNILFFSKNFNVEYAMPYWIFFLLIPITLVSGISTLRGVAETGFWFSALEDILPIFIIVLTFSSNISAIIMVVIGLMAFEMSGIYSMINMTFLKSFNIGKKDNTALSIISSISGAFISISLVLLFQHTFGLGTKDLPVPFAKVFGMTVKGLVESLSTLSIPGYININIIIIAAVICLILNKLNLSPIIIIGGILLPFSTYITMSIGAIISFIVRPNVSKHRPIFSGIATGDGLISALSAMFRIPKG
jgi:hypothetical protein